MTGSTVVQCHISWNVVPVLLCTWLDHLDQCFVTLWTEVTCTQSGTGTSSALVCNQWLCARNSRKMKCYQGCFQGYLHNFKQTGRCISKVQTKQLLFWLQSPEDNMLIYFVASSVLKASFFIRCVRILRSYCPNRKSNVLFVIGVLFK